MVWNYIYYKKVVFKEWKKLILSWA
jgi:hypothetical protein